MSRRTRLLSVLIGLGLLVGAPGVWWALQPDATVGDVPGPDATSGSTSPVDGADRPATTGPRTVDDRGDRAPSVSASSPSGPASTADVSGESAAGRSDAGVSPGVPALDYDVSRISGTLEDLGMPIRLELPSRDIDAAVDPVGIEPGGAMEIPDDIDRVGWFAPGIRPGRAGTAVLSGHVDSRTQGRGAFYELHRVTVGEVVTITHDDGQQRDWHVVGRTSYGKADIPLDEIFTRSGDPRLALITCGGPFDSATRSYQENVVVFAEPV